MTSSNFCNTSQVLIRLPVLAGSAEEGSATQTTCSRSSLAETPTPGRTSTATSRTLITKAIGATSTRTPSKSSSSKNATLGSIPSRGWARISGLILAISAWAEAAVVFLFPPAHPPVSVLTEFVAFNLSSSCFNFHVLCSNFRDLQ